MPAFVPTVEQAQAIADQIKTKHAALFPNMGSRLVSALRIATTEGQILGDAPLGTFVVTSESNPKGKYRVNLDAHECTCPDAGRGYVCKHRLAAYIWQQSYLSYCKANPAPAYEAQVNDIGLVRYSHPLIGQFNVTCQLNALTTNPRGEIAYLVFALPTNPNGRFDYRYPFSEGIFEVAFTRILPTSWRFLYRPLPGESIEEAAQQAEEVEAKMQQRPALQIWPEPEPIPPSPKLEVAREARRQANPKRAHQAALLADVII